MIHFIIENMTCGHCENVVTRTIQSADPAALVEIDLANHQVNVHTRLQAETLADVLQDAGYPPALHTSASTT